jgi:hypothetical protein
MEETKQQERRWHQLQTLQAQSTEERRGDTPLGYSGQITLRREQCGIFTPCKNCNIKTLPGLRNSRQSGVFSVTSIALPRLICCQATAINTWLTQEAGGVTWPLQQWRHAFQQWRNNWRTIGRNVSCVSDQGFIGETEARLRASLGGRLQ